MNRKYVYRGLINAILTAIYAGVISWLLFNGEWLFGNKPDNFLMPLLMLMIFVISAAITGFLVLGKPIRLYMEGLKKEAVNLFFITLGWLAVCAIIVAVLLVTL